MPEGVQGTLIGFQIPERSGVLPSAIFGAGAVSSGVPFGCRGTRGVFTFCHWADKGNVANATTPTNTLGTIGGPGIRFSRERLYLKERPDWILRRCLRATRN